MPPWQPYNILRWNQKQPHLVQGPSILYGNNTLKSNVDVIFVQYKHQYNSNAACI